MNFISFDYLDDINDKNSSQYFITKEAEEVQSKKILPGNTTNNARGKEFLKQDQDHITYSKVIEQLCTNNYYVEQNNQYGFNNIVEINESDDETEQYEFSQQYKLPIKKNSAEQKDLFVQNGRLTLIEENNFNLLDKSLKDLKFLVIQYAEQNNLKIENLRCSYDKNNRIFVIYDEKKFQFCFFDVQKKDVNEIKFMLQDDQLFYLDYQKQILYISRQYEQKNYINSFSIQIEQQIISILKEKEFEIDQPKIDYFYVKEQNIIYLYKQLEESEDEGKEILKVFQNDQEVSYKCILYDIFNNSFAICNDTIDYNLQYLYNREYDKQIQKIIDEYDQNQFCSFKVKQKYNQNQLKIKYINNSHIQNKIIVLYKIA